MIQRIPARKNSKDRAEEKEILNTRARAARPLRLTSTIGSFFNRRRELEYFDIFVNYLSIIYNNLNIEIFIPYFQLKILKFINYSMLLSRSFIEIGKYFF